MRRHTKDAIVKAMTAHPRSTARELQQHTGLAYNTVKTALAELHAVPVDTEWPVRWRMPTSEDDTPQGYVPVLDDVTIESWNDETWQRIVDNVKPIANTDDPRELARRLHRIAEITGGMALTLESHQDSPGWFYESGGQSGTAQVN